MDMTDGELFLKMMGLKVWLIVELLFLLRSAY
jgi:hypothetical protein